MIQPIFLSSLHNSNLTSSSLPPLNCLHKSLTNERCWSRATKWRHEKSVRLKIVLFCPSQKKTNGKTKTARSTQCVKRLPNRFAFDSLSAGRCRPDLVVGRITQSNPRFETIDQVHDHAHALKISARNSDQGWRRWETFTTHSLSDKDSWQLDGMTLTTMCYVCSRSKQAQGRYLESNLICWKNPENSSILPLLPAASFPTSGPSQGGFPFSPVFPSII